MSADYNIIFQNFKAVLCSCMQVTFLLGMDVF